MYTLDVFLVYQTPYRLLSHYIFMYLSLKDYGYYILDLFLLTDSIVIIFWITMAAFVGFLFLILTLMSCNGNFLRQV